jgi:hypothetical protein
MKLATSTALVTLASAQQYVLVVPESQMMNLDESDLENLSMFSNIHMPSIHMPSSETIEKWADRGQRAYNVVVNTYNLATGSSEDQAEAIGAAIQGGK